MSKLYIEVGGYYYDITPLRATLTTPDTDNCVETTSGSQLLLFCVTAHGCLTGDYVTISGVTGDVGGIPDAEINTEHVITKVDDDNFTFTVTTAATSTTSGGGTAIDIECQIHPGFLLSHLVMDGVRALGIVLLVGGLLLLFQWIYHSKTGF
jgi:hypothetical protein